MTRSRRLLAAGFAAALGIAGVTIGSGSLSASSGGGLCEGIDLGATRRVRPRGDRIRRHRSGRHRADGNGAGGHRAGRHRSRRAARPQAAEGATTVALMFDVTGRGDKSFNDAAAAGLDRAVAEFGDALAPTESPPQAADDRAERVAAAAEGGNQLVIATGFLWTDTITQAAAAYPDTHFLLIDSRRRGRQRGQHLVRRGAGLVPRRRRCRAAVRERTARLRRRRAATN